MGRDENQVRYFIWPSVLHNNKYRLRSVCNNCLFIRIEFCSGRSRKGRGPGQGPVPVTINIAGILPTHHYTKGNLG